MPCPIGTTHQVAHQDRFTRIARLFKTALSNRARHDANQKMPSFVEKRQNAPFCAGMRAACSHIARTLIVKIYEISVIFIQFRIEPDITDKLSVLENWHHR
jgi:hypothetical protein